MKTFTKWLEHMDITGGKWRVMDNEIEDKETGEVKPVKGMPDASTFANMDYEIFMRKVPQAFNSGEWPQTRWSSGRVSDY